MTDDNVLKLNTPAHPLQGVLREVPVKRRQLRLKLK